MKVVTHEVGNTCLYFALNTAENNFKNADFFVDRYALASRLAGQAIGRVGARYRAFEVLLNLSGELKQVEHQGFLGVQAVFSLIPDHGNAFVFE